MTRTHALGVGMLAIVFSTSAISGQTGPHYRDFELGSDLASIAMRTGTAASEAKTVHMRPALLQELQWRRPYAVSGQAAADPVQQIAFSFYNDQLFRMVIDYDRNRTEGLTDRDMVEAISAIYGSTINPSLKANRVPIAPPDEESGTRVAGWGDAQYSAVLYRSSYAPAFRMIVTSVQLNTLARTAEIQARRLDERDAPERERARQQKEAADARAAQEKARVSNKAAFRP